MQKSLYSLMAALSVQTVGMGADSVWHTLWHQPMRGEGLWHPWPHLLMAIGFGLTWMAAGRLVGQVRRISPAPTPAPDMEGG